MKPCNFNTSFSKLHQKVKKNKTKKTIGTGDLNLNLLNHTKNIGSYEFLESIFLKQLYPSNLPLKYPYQHPLHETRIGAVKRLI